MFRDHRIEVLELQSKLRDCKIETLENKTKRLSNQINLILEHLELRYEGEKTVKKPARLVDKKPGYIDVFAGMFTTGTGCMEDFAPPKKKRGRPKGSKNKKK